LLAFSEVERALRDCSLIYEGNKTFDKKCCKVYPGRKGEEGSSGNFQLRECKNQNLW
jgi:hypothetical protein